ncbi:MAG TPA: hypothetical protein VK272_02115, partial [Solirubrobacteraceae bacterium]|nr:hypothetical protein [Solirubrobacteraceae bacterium]
SPRTSAPTRTRAGAERASRASSRQNGERVRVHREARAVDDGYRSDLVPGLRASADASRLAREIAFSSARLLALAVEPPGLFGEVRALARAPSPEGENLERATWECFLIVYLCPLEGEDPFAGIRMALASAGAGELPDLDGVPLGPRSSHDPERGVETLVAYRQWVARAGDASGCADSLQAAAFSGDPTWSPQRRFERVFERLALPGFARMGRYELLVTLGRLGLYALQPDSLHLAGARGLSAEDLTTTAAKRVFGIGDPLLLERRAAALAQAIAVPIETLDLALANWISPSGDDAPQRATMGCPPDSHDAGALERAGSALGI